MTKACQYNLQKKKALNRTYTIMLQRTKGKNTCRPDIYAGLPICTRQEFLDRFMACPAYEKIYDAWIASGKERRLAPSPDRLVGKLGYVLSNIQMVAFGENVRRSSRRRNGHLDEYGIREELTELKSSIRELTLELEKVTTRLNQIQTGKGPAELHVLGGLV